MFIRGISCQHTDHYLFLGVQSDSLANKGGCGVDIKRDGSANTSLTGHNHLASGQRPSFVLTIVAVGLGT